VGSVIAVRFRVGRVHAVPDERLKTAAEHRTQLALKCLHRGKSVCHVSIINECAFEN
jgi:hypothetical protein